MPTKQSQPDDLRQWRAYEARVRRLAERYRLMLRKSRQTGMYYVSDPFFNCLLSGEDGLTLDDAEEFIRQLP